MAQKSVFFQPEEDVLFFNEKGELNGMFSELNAHFVVNDIIIEKWQIC